MADKVSCCPRSTIAAVTDWGLGVGSGLPFSQRIGAADTDVLPSPRVQPNSFRVHTIPLKLPTPFPELQDHFNGEEPPDRGKTLDWPHPDLETEAEALEE